MLESGQDPLYVARRLIRFASEDIGLADPMALVQANAGFQAAHTIGMPECTVALAQVVAYMASAQKSNSLYTAYEAIKAVIHTEENPPVPLHLRNAPTKLMKELGYSKGYLYNPDYCHAPEVLKEQTYLPESLKDKKFFVMKQNKSVQ
jgi:putative ATPase